MAFPADVRIVEVGPRDGLQNEATLVPEAVKVDLIARLAAAGLRTIEAGSFVAPKWVPQMAGSAEVLKAAPRRPGVSYPVLVPNMKGFEAALAAGAQEVAVFAAASEAFSQKNINCSIAESLARFAPVMEAARAAGVRVRGYVSCVLGCPYQGEVPLAAVVDVAERLSQMGCYEISLGDTIGVGTPRKAVAMLDAVLGALPWSRWPCISTTPTGRRSPTSMPASIVGWPCSMPPWAGSAGAPMRRERAAMWPRRISSTCWKAWASVPGSISRRWWKPPPSSRRPSAARPPPISPRLAAISRRGLTLLCTGRIVYKGEQVWREWR